MSNIAEANHKGTVADCPETKTKMEVFYEGSYQVTDRKSNGFPGHS